jgi:23S rRNA pseudouridine1911/1915/1917 synthase
MSGTRSAEARVDDPGDDGLRLDVFVAERMGLFSRSQARARIVSVSVNGAAARLARRVRTGDVISVSYTDPPAMELVPQDIPLAILYEDPRVVVIDKPQGMVVHPGSGNPTGTLVNALLHRYQMLAQGFGPGEARPGIVHRLDKDTSGVIITAKSAEAHDALAAQFHDRTVRKRYVAIVQGCPSPREGAIDAMLARHPRDRKRFRCVKQGGRPALTRYRVERIFSAEGRTYALVQLAPRTGRTHQLRVHLRHIGTPILGDPIYGRKDPLFPDATLMLHARSLRLRLPGEEEPRTFVSPIPERMRSLLARLQSFSPRSGL